LTDGFRADPRFSLIYAKLLAGRQAKPGVATRSSSYKKSFSHIRVLLIPFMRLQLYPNSDEIQSRRFTSVAIHSPLAEVAHGAKYGPVPGVKVGQTKDKRRVKPSNLRERIPGNKVRPVP